MYCNVRSFIAPATEPSSPSNPFCFALSRMQAGSGAGLSRRRSPAPTARPDPRAAAADPALLAARRIPFGSAPFQGEFNGPRRCSEDDLETKVKCNSFAHPCN